MILGASSCRYLLDTNIIVYPHDSRDTTRQIRARELLILLQQKQNAALPAQALAEFVSVALRKLSPPLDVNLIYLQIEALKAAFPVLPLTTEVVLEAVLGVRDHQFSYYDAQIWAVAKVHQISVILSEDFNNGAVIDGVTFLNPFDKSFDINLIRS